MTVGFQQLIQSNQKRLQNIDRLAFLQIALHHINEYGLNLLWRHDLICT